VSFAALPLAIVLGVLGASSVSVVLLYLLRRTPRPQVVSNVDFWLKALERARPRKLHSTRIPIWSLLVSLLAALLLAFLLGGPQFGESMRGTTVLIVSADASMGAEEDGVTRNERAIGEAYRWAERAIADGKVAVVRAGVRPSILVPLTDDLSVVSAGLGELEPDSGTADLEDAALLADRLVRRREGAGQILVFADRAAAIRTETPLVLMPVGGTAETLAITRVVARRDPIAVGEYSVLTEVASFSHRASEARLVIRDREVVIFDQPIRLGAGERMRYSAQGFSSAQGEITAELADVEIAGGDDALASDDRAFAVAPALGKTRVLLVTNGSEYLETVLASHAAVEVDVVAPGGLAGLSPDELLAHEVVILDRVVPSGGTLDHPGVLAIGAPGAQGFGTVEIVSDPRPSATLASHPALSGVRLDTVRILRSAAIDTSSTDHVLLRSGRSSLIAAREARHRRAISIGFALEDSDLGERVAFPLLMHHAIQWLRGNESVDPIPRAPGELVLAGGGATVLGPDAEALEIRGEAIDDTTRAGIYHVGERAVAVSGVPSPLPAPAPRAGTRGTGALPPLAMMVAGVLLFLILAEWMLLHRGKLA
jgi:hypothetical protein